MRVGLNRDMRSLQLICDPGKMICLVALFLLASAPTIATDGQPVASQGIDKLEEDKVQDRIEQLASEAYKCRTTGDIGGAVARLKEASVLNKPFAGRPNARKCLGHSSAEVFIVGSLVSIYEQEGRWAEAERLYETRYRKCFDNNIYSDEHIANLLAKQGKYKEARAILRKFVPQMAPPVSGGCGVPIERYMDLQQLYEASVKNTPDVTEAEMEELDRQREKKRLTSTP